MTTSVNTMELAISERIELLKQRPWVAYRQARQILEEWEEWLAWPRSEEMPGMLLYGNTGTGKSTLFLKFCEDHPRSSPNKGYDVEYIPVLRFITPTDPEPKALYEEILKRLGGPVVEEDRPEKRLAKLKSQLLAVGCRILCADEIQHYFQGISDRRMARAINNLKKLGEDLQVCIVLIGTFDALNVVEAAPELQRRFPPRLLKRWEIDFKKSNRSDKDIDIEKDYRQFLADLEDLLPLKEPSRLSSRSFATHLYSYTFGIRHNIIDLIRRTAIYALKQGEEKITIYLIDRFIEEYEWRAPAKVDDLRK